MKLFMKGLTVLSLLAVAAASMATGVTNGSFEEGSFNSSVYGGNWNILQDGSTAIYGWKVASSDNRGIDWANDLPGTNVRYASSGHKFVDLNNSAIFQDLSTVAGQQYTVSVDVANVIDGSNVVSNNSLLKISAAGQSAIYTAKNSYSWNAKWYRTSMSFTATSGVTRLTFDSSNATQFWGAHIDNVSVTATPEPVSMAVAAFGFAAVARAKRKRA